MSFDNVVDSLRRVHWGAATQWAPFAKESLLEYYRRLKPYWPEARHRLEPADRAVEQAALAALPEVDRSRIDAATRELLAAARGRGERVEATTARLIPLILAWSLAVERSELADAKDPGGPLVELFRAGYQIAYTNAGIEVWYSSGAMTIPVPSRQQL